MNKARGPDGLTEMQRAFVRFYLYGGYPQRYNATRSAIAAGYSERSARSIACELMQKPHVGGLIRRLFDRDMQRHEEQRIAEEQRIFSEIILAQRRRLSRM